MVGGKKQSCRSRWCQPKVDRKLALGVLSRHHLAEKAGPVGDPKFASRMTMRSAGSVQRHQASA
jgi:hypothetical protein